MVGSVFKLCPVSNSPLPARKVSLQTDSASWMQHLLYSIFTSGRGRVLCHISGQSGSPSSHYYAAGQFIPELNIYYYMALNSTKNCPARRPRALSLRFFGGRGTAGPVDRDMCRSAADSDFARNFLSTDAAFSCGFLVMKCRRN